MTITLELLPETQRKLEVLATRQGKDVTGFVHDLIERTIQITFPDERSEMRFDEITAPLRQDFQASEMTDAEFEALIEEVRQEVWEDRHKQSRAS